MERPLSAWRAGEVIPEGRVAFELGFEVSGRRRKAFQAKGSVSAGSSAGVRLPGKLQGL